MVRSLLVRPRLEKSALKDNILKDIPETSSTILLDSKGDVHAISALLKYSPTQAYCLAAEVSKNLDGEFISIKNTNDPSRLLITETNKNSEDYRFMPVYVQVHHNPEFRRPLEHIIDHLFESALGRLNLDLKKNVTVDLMDAQLNDEWGDKIGFIVTDRLQLRLLTSSTTELLKTLKPTEDVQVFKVEKVETLLALDQQTSGLKRTAFLEYLLKKYTIKAAKRDETSGIEGYIVTNGNRVTALYAYSEDVAHTLMQNYLLTVKPTTTTMAVQHGVWEAENLPSAQIQCIHRRHTRSMPANIKWCNVYVLNAGLHIL